MESTQSANKVRVTLIRSLNGRLVSHQSCIRGLGLRRLNQTVELENSSCIRGMINKVRYMVRVEEID